MKKVVVITITYNRLETTKKWLSQLKEKAGYDFYHLIVDNGSTDGTIEYLTKENYHILSLDKNYGVLKAWQIGIEYALNELKADYIVKYDNDCEIITDNILSELMKFYEKNCDNYVIAPFDTILNEEKYANFKPRVIHKSKQTGINVKYVTHTGGIFQVLPKKAAEMLINETDEKFITGDGNRGAYWRKRGIDILYLTDLHIYHRGVNVQSDNYKL